MEKTQAQTLATKLMREHGLDLPQWRFAFSRTTRSLGDCQHRIAPAVGCLGGRIRLSEYFVAEATREHVEQVVLHEIAHALTPGHNHDRVWLRKARELGYIGGRLDTSGIDLQKHAGRKPATPVYRLGPIVSKRPLPADLVAELDARKAEIAALQRKYSKPISGAKFA